MNKIILNTIILLTFSIVYIIYMWFYTDYWLALSREQEEETKTTLNHIIDGFYASSVIHTSVGFGGFPKKLLGKLLVILHCVSVFFINMIL